MKIEILDDLGEIFKKSKKEFLLFDFWTPRCEPCRFNAVVTDELSRECKDRLDVASINVDKNPWVVASLQLRLVPAMMLYNRAALKRVFYGLVSKSEILEQMRN